MGDFAASLNQEFSNLVSVVVQIYLQGNTNVGGNNGIVSVKGESRWMNL